MSRNRVSLWFMAVSAAVTMLIMGAGTAFAVHPDIPLYTYEEVAQQMGQPMMPVALDADYKGFPYSPKQTCGNCHNGQTTSNDQQYTFSTPLVSYDEMNSTTFHAQLDGNALVDTIGDMAQGGKPWTQSVGMAGKW